MTFPVGAPNPSFSLSTFAPRPPSLNTLQTPSSQTQQAMKFSATYLLPTSKPNMYRLERSQRTRIRCCTASHTRQRSCRFGDLFGGVGQQQGVPEPLNEKKNQASGRDRTYRAQTYRPPCPRVLQARINTQSGSSNCLFKEIAPFCVSANNLINPLPPSLLRVGVFHLPPTLSRRAQP